MTAAYSCFAKVGPPSPRRPPATPRLPRGMVLLAIAVATVLAALPLASSARDRLTDARLAALDATDRAGDFGPIKED